VGGEEHLAQRHGNRSIDGEVEPFGEIADERSQENISVHRGFSRFHHSRSFRGEPLSPVKASDGCFCVVR